MEGITEMKRFFISCA